MYDDATDADAPPLDLPPAELPGVPHREFGVPERDIVFIVSLLPR